MSRSENYYDKLQQALNRALVRREVNLRDLFRTETTIRDLRIRLKRGAKGAAEPKLPVVPTATLPPIKEVPPVAAFEEEPSIPDFLRRDPPQAEIAEMVVREEAAAAQRQRERINAAMEHDKEIADRIRAEQAEKKKLRAKSRKEKADIVPPSKFKDEKARQMPLTGRDALRFIKEKR